MARILPAFLLAIGLSAPAAGALADAFDDGFAAAQRGDYQAAVAEFTRAIDSGTLDAENLAFAYSNRGYVHSTLGEDQLAIADYSAALALAPDNPDILSNRANAFRRLGDKDSALRDYQQAVDLRSDDPDLRYNLGNAFLALGRYDDAVDAFRASLSLEPDEPAIVHNNLGIAYDRRGDADAALQEYGTALELNPDYATAVYNRALLHQARGDLQLAYADAARAAGLEPGNATYRDRLGEVETALAEAGLTPLADASETATAGTGPAGTDEGPAGEAGPAAMVAAAGGEASAADAATPEGPAVADSGEGRPYRAREDVNMRSGPSPSTRKLAVVYGGETVHVIGSSGVWLQIRNEDGVVGYAHGNYLEPIE